MRRLDSQTKAGHELATTDYLRAVVKYVVGVNDGHTLLFIHLWLIFPPSF